jgi:hypothetical protein
MDIIAISGVLLLQPEVLSLLAPNRMNSGQLHKFKFGVWGEY